MAPVFDSSLATETTESLLAKERSSRHDSVSQTGATGWLQGPPLQSG